MAESTPNEIPLADRTDLSVDVLIYIQRFTESNGRKPTDDEVMGWIKWRNEQTSQMLDRLKIVWRPDA